jgi:hypothetical protein
LIAISFLFIPALLSLTMMKRSTMPACKEGCSPVKLAKMAAKGAPTTADDAVEEELPSEEEEDRR